MIHRLPKKHREKYQRKRSWDEEALHFIVKVVSSTALLFLVAAGIDIYHLIH